MLPPLSPLPLLLLQFALQFVPSDAGGVGAIAIASAGATVTSSSSSATISDSGTDPATTPKAPTQFWYASSACTE
ncbi:GD16189 [Drosophila simulans]|uniref:GD16189 n=1 Tax=Drosophila simulans TaxID=7240 RepID=B4R5M8_DROSI|nr:GD16189 [Drosophila simulans]